MAWVGLKDKQSFSDNCLKSKEACTFHLFFHLFTIFSLFLSIIIMYSLSKTAWFDLILYLLTTFQAHNAFLPTFRRVLLTLYFLFVLQLSKPYFFVFEDILFQATNKYVLWVFFGKSLGTQKFISFILWLIIHSLMFWSSRGRVYYFFTTLLWAFLAEGSLYFSLVFVLYFSPL